MPGCPRRESCELPFQYRFDARASQLLSVSCGFGFLHFTDPEFGSVNFDAVTVERSRSRPSEYAAVQREGGRVAGTQKFLVLFIPVIRASEVRALRGERNHILFRRSHDPGCRLFARNFPTIYACPPEHHLFRRVHTHLRDIADLDPLRFLFDAWWKQ